MFSYSRLGAVVASLAILASSIVSIAVDAPAASAAGPAVTLTVSGNGGSILAGTEASYTLTATNAGDADGFNLAFAVDVPKGVAFAASDLGAPVTYDDVLDFAGEPVAAAGMVRWVWQDAADLPVGASYSLSLTVQPAQPAPAYQGFTTNPAVFPVGSTFTVTSTAYLSSDARYLPVFSGSTGVGGATAIAATLASASIATTTRVTAITLSKSEQNPEAELLRGVHAQSTVYSLTVTNNDEYQTRDATVTDYLPAGLEFLGCRGVDNGIDQSEYSGSGALAGTVLADLAPFTGSPASREGCLLPASVETIALSGGITGSELPDRLPDGVYTKVVWNIGTLPAGSVTTLHYAAAVPLYENTMNWDVAATPTVETAPATTPSAPTALAPQAANLDNNTGTSTRHGDAVSVAFSADAALRSGDDGDSWTNRARVHGTYDGVVRAADATAAIAVRAVFHEDDVTITAMDLAVVKSVWTSKSSGTDFVFVPGEAANFTLTVRSGEYASADGVILRDTVRNGLCPVVPAGTATTVVGAGTFPAECAPGIGAGIANSAPIVGASVSLVTYYSATGRFTMTLAPVFSGASPDVIAPNSTHLITYSVLMREQYELASEYGPTTSGDSFVNSVDISGETTVIVPVAAIAGQLGVQDVWDDSGITIGSEYTTIDKQVLARGSVLTSASDPCAVSDGALWLQGVDATNTPTGFRTGDTVCYRLTVDFPHDIATRNAVLTDFLPAGLVYAGSRTAGGSTVPSGQVSLDLSQAASDGRLTWTVGDVGAGDDLYVAAGGVLQYYVWATVAAPASGAVADKPQNLMKYRQENVAGAVYFLRDAAAIEREPALSLTKGVADVNGVVVAASAPALAGDQFGSNRDGIRVVAGDVVTYRVDLSGGAEAVTGLEAWDALPAGITCADLVAGSFRSGGVPVTPTCSVVASGLNPASLNGRSVVKWSGITIPAAVFPAATGRQTLTYDLVIPTGISVETSLTNTASVVAFDSGANGGSTLIDYPADSLDLSRQAQWNFPAGLIDTSTVSLPAVAVSKAASSPVDTNNTSAQAVPGEIITYSYTASIPAGTTVYNAVLKDTAMPAGLSAIMTSAPYAPTYSFDGSATMPATGFVFAPSSGQLTFPAAYTNGTTAAQVFAVTFSVWATTTATKSNTATFTSTANASAASAVLSQVSAPVTVTVPRPNPLVDKFVSKVDATTYATTGESTTRPATATSTVEYTLAVTNATGLPTAYDTVVTDCVPAGVIVDAGSFTPAGPTTSTSALCSGGTLITWNVGTVLAGTPQKVTYLASFDTASAGNQTYTNTATLTGKVLPASTPSGYVAAVAGNTNVAIVKMQAATMLKTGANLTNPNAATPTSAVIGDAIRYTLTTTIPSNVNFYETYIQDVVPAGIRVTSATVTAAAGLTITGPTPTTTAGTAATTLTWLISDGVGGDIHSAAAARQIVITYDAIVVDTRVDPSAPATTPAPVAGNDLVNTANFAWQITDGAIGTPQKSANATKTFRVYEPSLSIVKKVNAADAIVVRPGGAAFTYTLAVSNANTATTSTAYDVVVVDTVPAGIIVDPSTISGTATTHLDSAGIIDAITWTVPSIAKNGTATLSYQATIAASSTLTDGEVLTNSAQVTRYYSLPSTTANPADRRSYVGTTDTAAVTAVFPVLAVTKTAASATAYVGANSDFSVIIRNTGSAAASTVAVVDTLPAGWRYVANSARLGAVVVADPTVAGQALTWGDLGAIAAGASATLTYQAVPDSAFAWAIATTGSTIAHTNSVVVTANDGSGAPSNKTRAYTASAAASVAINRADLAITKSHTGTVVAGAGAGFTWTMHVENLGPDAAVGPIVVTDTLPAGVSFVSAAGTGWTVSGPAAGTYTFTHAGPVAVNGSLPDISIVSRVPAGTAAGTVIANTATVSGATFETVTSNNTSTDSVTVTAIADLGIVKDVTATSFVAGEDATWTVAVTNYGPSVSRGPITVTDSLPSGIGAAVASGAGWVCDPADAGEIECVYAGDLAVGQTAAAITVTTPVLSSTTAALYNVATVAATTPEPTPGAHANTDAASVDPVGTAADLAISKTITSDSLSAGATGTYRIYVDNLGPSDALNVTVVDQLPAGLSLVAGTTTAGWACAARPAAPQYVDCALTDDLGTLDAAASSWFEFDVAIGSGVSGTILNTATVFTTTHDTDPANDTDDVAVTALLDTDVTVDKQTTATIVQGGDIVEYTIQVSNTGIADAAAVTVTDFLPAQLKVTNITLAAGATPADPEWTDPCAISETLAGGFGGRIDCVLDATLIAGTDAPLITVEVEVAADAYTTDIINVARVAWTDLGSPTVHTHSDNTSTPLKWIHYEGDSRCTADVQWFDYELTTSSTIDTTALPVTIQWFKDSDGNGVPEEPTDTESDPIVDSPSALPVSSWTIDAGASVLRTAGGEEYPVTISTSASTTAAARTLAGAALWPGAEVDASGVGIAWPGWRIAEAGETPTWENLIYDETLFGANLRAGAMVVIAVNPTTTVIEAYPAATPECTLARDPSLTLTKTASVADADTGDTFDYVLSATNVGLGATNSVLLVDHMPASMKVTGVTPAAPSAPTIPAWNDCTVTLQDARGYGGDVTCTLAGYLGAGQSAPDVVIHTMMGMSQTGKPVVNHASLWWSDPDDQSADGLRLATASINDGWLAHTGIDALLASIVAIVVLLTGGAVLVIVQRRRRSVTTAV